MASLPSGIAALPPKLVEPSTPAAAPRQTSRKWLKWIIIALPILAAAIAFTLWQRYQQTLITYETVPVEQGTVQARVTATGTVNGVVDVLISSQVSGNIKTLYADWNSKVTKGQLVALIDPEIFQAQLDEAKATYRSAQSASLTAMQQLEKAKSDVSSAMAAEKDAEAIAAKDAATEANAASQWSRAEDLYHQQIMAQQDHDTAQATYRAAVAQVNADKAQIDAAKQNVQSAQATERAAQSQLATAQAQEHEQLAALQLAQTNLDHTRIMSPVDGTVVARRMDVGQTVAATLNPPTIFEIVQDLTKMQVDTNVDESDVGGIVKGQKATFVVDAYPDTTFHGTVFDIRKAPIVTQNVVTYDVVLTVDNSDLKLFPGMTANVTILTAKLDNTLKVPNAVLRFHPSAAVIAKNKIATAPADQQRLYVLSNGKITPANVKFGLSDGRYTAVQSDQLKPGMQVIVRANTGTTSTTTPTTAMPGPPRM